ncbi:MAG: tetratricopeptide repeat protein [Pedosphaera sp.]|nr:tetratricopeptide repeat protein [Pedosphaera sp.]
MSQCLSLALLALGLVGLSGCQTPRRGPTAPAAVPPPTPAAESHADLEKRAEAHARFAAGFAFELNRQTARALDEYYLAVLANPGDEVLALDLSRRFIQDRQFDRAAELLQKAAAEPNSTGLVSARLGYVYLQMGRTNAAIDANRMAIKKSPRFIAGYQNLFLLYSQTGRPNEAGKVISEAARQPQPDAAFLVDLADLHFAQNRAAKTTNSAANLAGRNAALAALHGADKLNPTNLFVLQKLADGFSKLGETKKAAAVYLKLLERYPDLPDIHEKLADVYLRDQDKKRAAEQLEAIVRDNPTSPQAWYFLGTLAYEDKRYERAGECYQKTILLNPGFEQAYYDLAAAQVALNKPRGALDHLDRARVKFGQSFVGEFFSAIAWTRLKDYTNALRHYTHAEIVADVTDTNRLNHTFYFQIGSTHERAGNIAQAEKYFFKSLQLSPDFAECLNYLGYMWAEHGTNLTKARELIDHALRLEPKNGAYLDSLGWVLFKQGQPREALKHILKSIELTEEPDATLFDHLGDVHAALKEHDKARAAWRKALSLGPSPAIEKKLRAAPGQNQGP